MKNLISYIDNNSKEDLYNGIDVNHLYNYLNTIWAPTNLKYSSQHYHHFGPQISKESGYLHPVITALRVTQGVTCEYCRCPEHKDESCIIRVPNLLPPSDSRKKNPHNAVHWYPPKKRTKIPSSVHFNPQTLHQGIKLITETFILYHPV